MTKINFIADPESVDLEGTIIPNPDAIRMVMNYQVNHSGNPHRTYATKFTLVDVDSIKALIDKTKADGFALYFATYPGDGTLDPSGKIYRNRDTVIVVPTIGGKPVPPIDFSIIPNPIEPSDGTAYDHGELEP